MTQRYVTPTFILFYPIDLILYKMEYRHLNIKKLSEVYAAMTVIFTIQKL